MPPEERENDENWYRLDIDFLRELLVRVDREKTVDRKRERRKMKVNQVKRKGSSREVFAQSRSRRISRILLLLLFSYLQISRHERRPSQLEELNEMPLYPTEDIIWNESVVPTEYFSGEDCLALPKLNLQFLTLHDYLLRNFNLFRLESTCK